MKTLVDKQDPVRDGMKRQWTRCKECGNVAYYDFVPYSLSNPIRTLPCGHGLTIRFDEAVDFITAVQAAEEKT